MNKEMFNPKTVIRFSSKIKLNHKQRTSAKAWLYLLEQGKLKKEKLNYFKFVEYILKDLLGYDIKEDMDFEAGNIEFSFKNNQGKTILGIEAKGTKTKDLFAEQKGYREGQKTPINQLWTYMGNLNLAYGIATNYKDFVLIERSSGLSTYHFFNFADVKNNDEKLKEFISIFSKEQIINNNFVEKLKEESAIEERKFTKEFYKIFHETRLMLLKEFQENGVSKEEALHYAQLYLNRLMFVFFAEDTLKLDRRIFEDLIIEALKAEALISAHSKLVSGMIISLFRRLDKGANTPRKIFGFNGGLFKEEIPANIFFKDFRDRNFFKDIYQFSTLKKELELDTVSKPILEKYGKRLNPIINNLFILASFDFNTEVNVNILGHIFEQSLSDLEELKDEKSKKRNKDGIFYTPEYITDYICRNTIIPYLSKKNAKSPRDLVLEYSKSIKELEEKLKNLKILDPACGSGAFLIKTVDILLDIHKEIQIFKQDKGQYTAIKRKRKRKKDEGQLMLIKWSEEDEAREIIENNIYGVDLNEESVEITKLSLFLKIARKNKKLIDLSKNIKCGNSLINDDSIDKKAFNWEKEFPFKFDIVIGNPPYVRNTSLDNLAKEFFSKNYLSAFKQYDLYILFIERGLSLLKEKGLLSFINPNKFFVSDYGLGLRKMLVQKSSIKEIIDLSKHNIFEDASTYPCIITLENAVFPNNKISYYASENITINQNINLSSPNKHSQEILNENNSYKFLFNRDKNKEIILKKIIENSKLIGELYSCQRGVPNNKLEFLNSGYSAIKSIQVKKYCILDGDIRVKFVNNKFEDLYKNLFSKKMILLPRTVINLMASLKNDGRIVLDRIYFLIRKSDLVSDKYVTSLLNSKLITFWFNEQFASTKVQGGYFDLRGTQINSIPVKIVTKDKQLLLAKLLDEATSIQNNLYKKKQKFISKLTNNLQLDKISKKLDCFYLLTFQEFIKEIARCRIHLTLNQQDEWEDYFENYKHEILELENQVTRKSNKIDEMTYELYDLNSSEKEIVERCLNEIN